MLPYRNRLTDMEIESVCLSLRKIRQVVQKKIITRFINAQLNKINLEIGDLYADFSEGFLLGKFLELTLNTNIRLHRGPIDRQGKLENVSHCLETLVEESIISGSEYNASDIVDQSRVMIHSFAWKIIMRCYFPHSVHPSQTADDLESQLLLSWCRSRIERKGFAEIAVLDFDYSWHDGRALGALIHSIDPNLIGADEVKNLNNVEEVLVILADNFNLAPLFLPEQLATGSVDQRLMIGFLESIRSKFLKIEFNGGNKTCRNNVPKPKKPERKNPKTGEPKPEKPEPKEPELEEEPKPKEPEKSVANSGKSTIGAFFEVLKDFVTNPVVQNSAIVMIAAILFLVYFQFIGKDLLKRLICFTAGKL